VRFESTSRSSMPPAMRRVVTGTGTVAVRAATAAVGASPPKEVSLTDPQATWVARPGVDPFFAYDANYLIDNKVGIIVDAEGTRANRTVEISITETMIERAKRRFDLRPQRLAGDSVYGAVRLLKWLVDRKITPHVPGTSRHATTAPSAELTLSSTGNVTSTYVRVVQSSPAPATSIRATSSITELTGMTARPAR
jgi:hypothetical protein